MLSSLVFLLLFQVLCLNVKSNFYLVKGAASMHVFAISTHWLSLSAKGIFLSSVLKRKEKSDESWDKIDIGLDEQNQCSSTWCSINRDAFRQFLHQQVYWISHSNIWPKHLGRFIVLAIQRKPDANEDEFQQILNFKRHKIYSQNTIK